MSSDLTNEIITRVRGWLGAHVEATALHAAVELRLLSSLQRGAQSHIMLAEQYGYEPYSVRVIMDILAGLKIVTKSTEGYYELSDALKTALNQKTIVEIRAAMQGWQSLAQISFTTYDELFKSAQAIYSQESTEIRLLLECAWKYVWSAGVMELGKQRIFSLLDEHPLSFSDLVTQSQLSEAALTQLCLVGEHTGLISSSNDQIELTQEARRAFGKGSIKEYCRWMEQRLMLERKYFYSPLGMLHHYVRTRQPISLSSSLGSPANSQFRRSFIRANRPFIPLLYHTARKVVSAIDVGKQPIRMLEIGAALGCWGIAVTSAHQKSCVVSVDTPEALVETQRIVAAAGVNKQYTWVPSNMQRIEQEDHTFDLIVLNEICHTVTPTLLASWLENIVRLLTPDGILIIADMVLDENYASPFRHLLSATKLLVTGGGRVLSINDHQQMLNSLGLAHVQLQRLATTDLIVASRKKFSLTL